MALEDPSVDDTGARPHNGTCDHEAGGESRIRRGYCITIDGVDVALMTRPRDAIQI